MRTGIFDVIYGPTDHDPNRLPIGPYGRMYIGFSVERDLRFRTAYKKKTASLQVYRKQYYQNACIPNGSTSINPVCIVDPAQIITKLDPRTYLWK